MTTTLTLAAITPPPRRRRRLEGATSLSNALTLPELRALLFVLAQHAPADTTFREIEVPLQFVFGPALGDAYEAARSIFSHRSPVLTISQVDLFGLPVHRGSFCMMPLLSCLRYCEGDSFVEISLNDCIIEYLPQLLELLRPEMAQAELAATRPSVSPLALAA